MNKDDQRLKSCFLNHSIEDGSVLREKDSDPREERRVGLAESDRAESSEFLEGKKKRKD